MWNGVQDKCYKMFSTNICNNRNIKYEYMCTNVLSEAQWRQSIHVFFLSLFLCALARALPCLSFFAFFFFSPSLVISATLSAFSHENRETDPSLSFYLKMLANPQTLSKLSWLNEAEDRLIPPPPPSLEAPWCRRAENEGSPLAVCLDVEGKVNKHTVGDGAGN